jgi:hypothetical protein
LGNIKDPIPVKYFCGVITAFADAIPRIRKSLEKLIGTVDIEIGPCKWDFTSYYSKDMGENLNKYLFSFKELRSPAELSMVKIGTNHIEDVEADISKQVNRPVNLDPGYITPAAMILASTKNYAHRIYIGGGIYAQVDYIFRDKGKIDFNPWVYPDYKTTEYLDFFNKMRKELLSELNKK